MSSHQQMCHVRDSDLAAIALDDYSVVLFDCAALSIVRRFGKGSSQHKAAISDLGFSPDGRTLYTSSLDSTVRVWDVPTNTCVDWLGFKSPPTALTVSPTGEYLATTHAGKLGVCIWSDKSFYQTVHVDGVDPVEPARMDEPMPMADVSESTEHSTAASATSAIENKSDDNGSDNEEEDAKMPAIPKEPGLITLSGLPIAHWKNLFHLELVKQRNKPKEPPKKPPSAPFFLQWRSGEPIAGEAGKKPEASKEENAGETDEWAAAWSDDDNEESGAAESPKATSSEPSKREGEESSFVVPNKRRKVTHYRSHLSSLLRDCSSRQLPKGRKRFQPVSDYIAGLGPSAIDVELSALCNGMHDLEEGLPLLLLASQWLVEACDSRERFEAVNAYLHRFLYLHSFVIAGINEEATRVNTDDADHHDHDSPEELELKRRERDNRLLLLATISQLKRAQQAAAEGLRGKMEHSLCLLRHFSRMV